MITAKSLRGRLTQVYVSLFAVILMLVAGAVYLSIKHNAERTVEAQLRSSVAVFEQIWELNASQLADETGILASDFGFRGAVASEDVPTIASALDNAQIRLGLDRAFVVLKDGRMITEGANSVTAPDNLMQVLRADGWASGVVLIGEEPFQAVSAPVLTPTKAGWAIFAMRIDSAYIKKLTSLSAIPVNARLETSMETDLAPDTIFRDHGAIGTTTSIKGLMADLSPRLIVTYPLSEAMKPYQPMLLAIMLFSLTGLILLTWSSWHVASGMTRPIKLLDLAAQKMARGDKQAKVDITSSDEIGSLATSFNTMLDAIRNREADILRVSRQDTVTGLPNRRALDDLIEIRDTSAENGMRAVVIRIRRFGDLRSAVGHTAAAVAIQELAARLGQFLGNVMIARITHSDLAFLLPMDHRYASKARIEDLIAACSQPVTIDGSTVDLLLVGGFAVPTGHLLPKIDLIEQASVAADMAEEDRLSVAEFDLRRYGDPTLTLALMSEMMTACNNGNMHLELQPKYSFSKDRISGLEALIRWSHPERGTILPDAFIPIAEETGHIRQLTQWVVEEAIREQEKLKEAGFDLPISVNVSGRQLCDSSFAQWAISTVSMANAKLCFEITETAVFGDPAKALHIINLFRDTGISISIDDYGAGLSSLSYLKQIPANELKIDKSFILSLKDSSSDSLLIKSTIDLAHALGMTVVAEGVETEESLSILRAMGADTAQGYYISRPQTRAQLIDLLQVEETAVTERDRQKKTEARRKA